MTLLSGPQTWVQGNNLYNEELQGNFFLFFFFFFFFFFKSQLTPHSLDRHGREGNLINLFSPGIPTTSYIGW